MDEPGPPTSSSGENSIQRLPAFLVRLLVGEIEEPIEEASVDYHSADCICVQIEPRLERGSGIPPALRSEMRDGRLLGLRVTGDDPRHPFYEFGLRSGDLLLEINGQFVKDSSKVHDQFPQILRTSHSVRFLVERDEKYQEIDGYLREDGSITSQPVCYVANGAENNSNEKFRMKPFMQDGEIIGMLVNLQGDTHPLYQLGLRDQDIVLSLNGTKLNGPESLSNIYRTLRTTSTLEFKVLRANRRLTITKSLED